MKPTINTSLSTLPQLKLSTTSTERLNLSNPKIIEAQVLSSTLLQTKNISGNSGQQFLIKLKPSQSNNQQTLEVIADKAIAKGSQLTIKVSPEKTVQIVDIKQPLPTPPNSSSTPASFKEQVIVDNLLRQALPLKQTIVKLLPLLQQLITTPTPTGGPLPKPLTQAISQLLSSFPDTQTLQNPNGVKRSIINNGTFFESKLAEFVKTAAVNGITIKAQTLNQLVSQDIKGQLQQLIKLVDQLSNKTTDTPQPQTIKHGAETTSTDGAVVQNKSPQAQQLAASALPLAQQPLNLRHNTTNQGGNQELGLVLKQLSRQLRSSLAQTQVHQAETLLNRGQPQADGQPAVNNWALELPVFNGKQIDHIDLQINRDQENNEEGNKATQWTIMLSFDLHSLGKVKVQISVVEQSVSATVWSEAEQTHQTVKQHINNLQKNFEQVGIHVKRLDCLLGKPPVPKNELSQQLVDIHS